MKKRSGIIKYFIAAFGILLAFLVFFYMNLQILADNQRDFDNEVEKTMILLDQRILKIDLALSSMSNYFSTNKNLDKEHFEEFTRPFLPALDGVDALEFLPRVTHEARENVELKYKNAYPIEFAIKHKNQKGELVKAAPRKFYFPVLFINPFEGNEAAFGFDAYSTENRKNIVEEAIHANAIKITAPLKLVQSKKGTLGILAQKPVVDEDTLIGLAVCVYNIDRLVRGMVNEQFDLFNLKIHDQSEENQPFFISSPKDEKKLFASEGAIRKTIKVYNRSWVFIFNPKKGLLSFPHSLASYMILLLSFLATYLSYILIRNNEKHRKNLEDKVRKRTEELHLTLKQKDILLKEIHHRVKNGLQITSSLIRLQKDYITDENAIKLLNTSEERIHSMALVHKLLYQNDDLEYIHLDKYLDELVSYNSSLTKIKIKVSCPNMLVHIDLATPLSLILNECISNAIKHAFSTFHESHLIKVTVEEKENQLVQIKVTDNGKGVPDDDLKESKGLGLELITLLSEQIDAELKIAGNQKGTKITLLFKNETRSNLK